MITVIRKPVQGAIAQNVICHGGGGLNVDGCRVGTSDEVIQRGELDSTFTNSAQGYTRANRSMMTHKPKERSGPANEHGRWPANLIHDGSEEVVGLFPEPHGAVYARTGSATPRAVNYQGCVPIAPKGNTGNMHRFGDSGSAARFFYAVTGVQ